MTRSGITALIVTWNSAPTLQSCLTALEEAATAGELDLDVVVVDNASRDRSVDIALEACARVIQLPHNRGFAAAVNTGLEHVRHPLTLLINPDVSVDRYALVRAAAGLGVAGVGLVGANLRLPDGRPDPPAARRFRTLRFLAIEAFGLPHVSARLNRQYLRARDRQTSREVECINGAFMLLPTELLRDMGGLDEAVFLFLEDQDLCWRIRQRGLRVWFVADAHAVHHGSASIRTASPLQQANVYLHRIDASVELVNRLQGRWPRRAAVGLWIIRCAIGLAGSVLLADSDRRLRYRTALAWLAHQWGHRVPPPPVPANS